MKILKLFVISLISLVLWSEVDARPIYVYSKEGGKFTFNLAHGFYIGYNAVEQQVRYTVDANGGNIEEYHINCKGVGKIKCEAKTIKNDFVNVSGNNFSGDTFVSITNDIVKQVDSLFTGESGIRGSMCRKVSLISVEGERCLISFMTNWNINKDGSGTIIISVEQVKL